MATMSSLRRRMIEDMTVRNLSPATQRSYINAVSKFSRYFGRSPDRSELEDVRAFQVHLVSTGISWAALNQIVCALRFFYGVTLGQGCGDDPASIFVEFSAAARNAVAAAAVVSVTTSGFADTTDLGSGRVNLQLASCVHLCDELRQRDLNWRQRRVVVRMHGRRDRAVEADLIIRALHRARGNTCVIGHPRRRVDLHVQLREVLAHLAYLNLYLEKCPEYYTEANGKTGICTIRATLPDAPALDLSSGEELGSMRRHHQNVNSEQRPSDGAGGRGRYTFLLKEDGSFNDDSSSGSHRSVIPNGK